MTAAVPRGEDDRLWTVAGGAALAAHIALAALAFAWAREPAPPPPEPVVLLELPPEAAPASAAATVNAARPASQPSIAPPEPATPVSAPPMATPLPREAVTLPPPPPALAQPPRSAEAAAAVAPATPASATGPGTGNGSNTVPGTDAKAKQQEADYFALVSAHLNRRKVYPAEARKARQQGVVTVRFTVDRGGHVSAVSIKRGSGHDLLDRATLDLLVRVAPLPRMPASMPRDSVTLSLPIDYSLRTS